MTGPKGASVLFRKWKGGRDDESILKEKWLTFHDHKWLTFKRPLTAIMSTRFSGKNEKEIISRCYFKGFLKLWDICPEIQP